MRSAKRRERDQIFQTADRPVTDFSFNAETASVFDDMLERSVPSYAEMQRMLAQLAGDFAADGTNIYDIGCSTGTTLALLDALPQQVTLIGLDNSPAMLERAETALKGRLRHSYELRQADLNEGLSITNASAVVMSLTLQFVRPVHREGLLREVCAGINPEGCLLLIEKLVAQESMLNRLYIQHYYEFKTANGYSELEIARKREALENVLIPYRLEENDLMLRRAGFRAVDVFFKWYNFCGIIAVK